MNLMPVQPTGLPSLLGLHSTYAIDPYYRIPAENKPHKHKRDDAKTSYVCLPQP